MSNIIFNPADIIRDILAGNTSKFRLLADQYKNMVYRVCVSRLYNRSDADDAAQETFLRAFRSLRTFRSDSAFSTWLYRITVNVCFDMLRKQKREKKLLQDLQVRTEKKTYNSEENAVNLMFAVLPENYRRVLELKFIGRCTYAEIAEEEKITIDAVKARIKRARKKIYRHLRHKINPAGV
ncbi:MAG: hypothetical protein A2096_09930 [Spirochaetes bacterium GWF1_41_5]|nr:MAG: hypothetical protein A2096_09930 [Spirochaetes bacterium GWF1_41_5]HBE03979.1 hypothetical protein [Spirochaetia bacterium]